jgi:hypothetical protein
MVVLDRRKTICRGDLGDDKKQKTVQDFLKMIPNAVRANLMSTLQSISIESI